jgi:TPR repeat protein
MYASGAGVKKDYDQAFFWWHKAADQGHAMAQSNLAVLYFNGDSVDQD